MGLFKNLKQTAETATRMAANAEQQQQAMMAAQQNAMAPVDPSSEAWQAIHGVTLDRYAQISAALVRENLAGIEAVNAWVVSQGVPEGKWAEVQTGWVQRMATNEAVRVRYGVLYSQS